MPASNEKSLAPCIIVTDLTFSQYGRLSPRSQDLRRRKETTVALYSQPFSSSQTQRPLRGPPTTVGVIGPDVGHSLALRIDTHTGGLITEAPFNAPSDHSVLGRSLMPVRAFRNLLPSLNQAVGTALSSLNKVSRSTKPVVQ